MSLRRKLFRVVARFARLPAATRGALWMVLAAALMSSLAGLIRYLSATIHPIEIAFFRSFLGLVFVLPWLIRSGFPAARTTRLRLFSIRAVIGALAMLTWFYALAVLPLADAVALSFTAPLFVTAGAALFLGEDVRARRWTATIIGFCGAMVILRPGATAFSLAAMLVLFSAATMAAAGLMVKELSRTEPAKVIVLYMVLFMSPLTLIPALFVWTWPSPADFVWLLVLAAIATAGNAASTRALVVADISVVAPFDFVRLPFAAGLGFFAFGEVPDRWTWIGGAVIGVSSIYVAIREAKLERRARKRPPVPLPGGTQGTEP
jgi:drug/metabolite transporter (DMT)-like permease